MYRLEDKGKRVRDNVLYRLYTEILILDEECWWITDVWTCKILASQSFGPHVLKAWGRSIALQGQNLFCLPCSGWPKDNSISSLGLFKKAQQDINSIIQKQKQNATQNYKKNEWKWPKKLESLLKQ